MNIKVLIFIAVATIIWNFVIWRKHGFLGFLHFNAYAMFSFLAFVYSNDLFPYIK